MSYRFVTIDDRAALLDDDDGWHDLAAVGNGRFGPDPMEALADLGGLREVAATLDPRSASGSLAEARAAGRVGPPVPRPTNCFAVGLNYAAHIEETSVAPPANPLVFTKFPTCLVGPDADVVLESVTADWEVELVVVIGVGGRHIPADEVWSRVAGLMVGQDISDRALQFSATPPHFDLGKSRDTYGPTGPALVSVDRVGDPDDLELRCEVNGNVRQHGRSSSMIFDVPFLVAYLSDILTLRTGDLIFTGTPAGVGRVTGDALAPGDVITSTIEGLGTLVNRCV